MDSAHGLHSNLCSGVINSGEGGRLCELPSAGDRDLGRCRIGSIRSLPKTQSERCLAPETALPWKSLLRSDICRGQRFHSSEHGVRFELGLAQ